MKKIDRDTVQRILDAADIVEVVSDFVSLKRRGANYIGLCPFHNERTPSFSVSKSKGICKCFSCGKGGSPINFLMELEQMSYQEALRWLAKKYHIEIKEREETDEERRQASEREQMFNVNEYARDFYTRYLTESDEGRTVGLSYFRHRGISDAMIERFHLGFAPEGGAVLTDTALQAGFKEEFLLATGLTAKTEQGRIYDRFRGRVMYPVTSLSGKVVAFGGRTLRTDKKMAKYINSPESAIYHKSSELYGIYQARQAITRSDKCILVEGYMDVISMSQAGVENVVASSGTSLTEGQIRMIHRFTKNVTVIYDSDAAGIKASLRGIDLLLAEGLNIKVVLLPEGDDPDSFAQSHSGEEVEKYIAEHEVDFIRFKTDILLKTANNDPIERSKVISDILRSVSVIPDAVSRGVYADECARMMNVRPDMVHAQLKKLITDSAYRQALKQQGEAARSSIADLTPEQVQQATETDLSRPDGFDQATRRRLEPFERALLRLIIKYGNYRFSSYKDEFNNTHDLRVTDYVTDDLNADEVAFSNSNFAHCLEKATAAVKSGWRNDHDTYATELNQHRNNTIEQGRRDIIDKATSAAEIHRMEMQLSERANEEYNNAIDDFDADYVSKFALSSDDDILRRVSNELIADEVPLSKIHALNGRIPRERDRLAEIVPRTLHELKYQHLCIEIDSITMQLANAQSTGADDSTLEKLLTTLIERKALQREFAHYLGERNLAASNITNLQR